MLASLIRTSILVGTSTLDGLGLFNFRQRGELHKLVVGQSADGKGLDGPQWHRLTTLGRFNGHNHGQYCIDGVNCRETCDKTKNLCYVVAPSVRTDMVYVFAKIYVPP
jgi:hypothetical protein